MRCNLFSLEALSAFFTQDVNRKINRSLSYQSLREEVSIHRRRPKFEKIRNKAESRRKWICWAGTQNTHMHALRKSKWVSSISSPKAPDRWGLMAHACNLSTWQVVSGRSRVQSHPPPYYTQTTMSLRMALRDSVFQKSPTGDQGELFFSSLLSYAPFLQAPSHWAWGTCWIGQCVCTWGSNWTAF